MKVYCKSTRILDTCQVFFVLNGTEISILRISITPSMILDCKSFNHLEDYEEVSQKEFAKLADTNASKESVKRFEYEYNKLFN